MERLTLARDNFVKAYKTLEDILLEDFSIIVRDATIQRFEYTFEAFWKFVKLFLFRVHGMAPIISWVSCRRFRLDDPPKGDF